MTSDPIIGIDLGTTHSAVAIMEGGSPEIIENERGNRVTPSVVARKETPDGDMEWLVGEAAVNQEANNPEGTVRSFKRHMGDNEKTFSLNGYECGPEELSAKILQNLKRDAERFLGLDTENGEEIQKAIITVPAYFNSRQRQATRDAAEIAGLKALEVFDEPTSAALAYSRRKADQQEAEDKANEKRNLLVFDLGGGTFDVTVMEYGGAIDTVLATNGDTELGGDDWDDVLTEHFASVIEDDCGTNPLTDDSVGLSPKLRLKDKAREAKEELSSAEEYTVNLPFLFQADDGMYDFQYSITRAKFESITEHLRDQLIGPLETAITDVADTSSAQKPDSFAKPDIDEVLLVGGATRMPQVHALVEDVLGQQPLSSINPDEVVAEGAAYKAGSYSGEVTGVTLLDVVPLSIGLKVRNGLFERIIKKNTTRPVQVSRTFTTAASNQTSVNIEVFQGEREVAEKNDQLGEFILTGIPPAPAGTPQINVTFSIDDDGILSVKAEESVTGVNKEVTLEGREETLSQDRIDELKRDAEQFAEEDAARREQISVQNNAEKAVQTAYTVLDNQGESVSPDLRSDIHDAVDEVEKYLDIIRNDDVDVDVSDVRSATTELERAVEQIGKDVYQPDDAHQAENIDVENPEKDNKSAVPSDETAADASESEN